MVWQHSDKFVGHHSSHPLDVVHVQYQQYNDTLIMREHVC